MVPKIDKDTDMPRFVPEGALAWKDKMDVAVKHDTIIRRTVRTWTIQGGETIIWEKLDKRKVNIEPDEPPLDDLDIQEIEQDFADQLDTIARHALEGSIKQMYDDRFREHKEARMKKQEEMEKIKKQMAQLFLSKQ